MALPGAPPVLKSPGATPRSSVSKVVLTVVLALIVVTVSSVGVVLLRVTVTLETPTRCGIACWNIIVTSVSSPEPLDSYTVVLGIEGKGSPVSAPLTPGLIFGPGVRLTFSDIRAPSRLDAGDAFRLENPGNPGTCMLGLNSLRGSASVSWMC